MPGIALAGPLVGLAVVVAATAGLYLAGTRAGDRPDDVRLRIGHTVLEGSRPAVVVTADNPGPGPAVVGLSRHPVGPAARRFGDPATVRVPRRTGGTALLASHHTVVGVVAGRESRTWLVPLPPAGGPGRLVAAVGQEGGRLRVLRALLPPAPRGPHRPVATARGPGAPPGPAPGPEPPLDDLPTPG